jgi:hypothetical protein
MEHTLSEEAQFKKIQEDFRESLGALKDDHNDWREYDDFYLAKHWNTQRASWRPDPVINYIAYVVDQKAPQLTQNRPAGLILPTAQGDEDAAKLFTQVTDVIAERVDLDDKIDEVVRTGLLLGTAWFKVYWDNNISGGSMQRGNLFKGDVAIDCPDSSNIYHDPQANKVEDCRYIIYAVPRTVQLIEQRYKVKVDAERSFETEIYNRPGKDQSKDRVMFYEYWYKEDGGIHCIYAAGGKVLKEIKNVYQHGRYPFVRFVPKKKRKSLLGIGEPKNIINNQKLLNKLMEMPTTNALLTANPIALVNPQNGIDPNKWQAKPGTVWPVKDIQSAVKWLEPPKISGDVFKLIEKNIEVIERMAGIYDSNTGETPGGVTAAAAIQMLQEQGSIPIKGIARNVYQTLKDVYELMIELIKENYTETRYIRITDEQGNHEFMAFNAAQYAEIDFDVKVSAGASTPTSKAYIAQLANDLFERQVILPSEYVEMQEGLPNKERIVARLREQEQMQQTAPVGGGPVSPPGQASGVPDFETFYQNAPPELQQEMDLMMEQGMPPEAILQQLLA